MVCISNCQCKPGDGVPCWPISCPKQCSIIMEHHSKKDFDEKRFEEEACRLTPLFYSDFRKRMDALLRQARNAFNRRTMTRALLTTGFLEAFEAALAAGNTSRRILTPISGEEVEGIAYIKSTARDSEWAFAFVYMRGVILEWIREGLFTMKTAPRNIAIVQCVCDISSLEIKLQCALLVGDDFTIEYEDKRMKSYQPTYADDMLKWNLEDICKRLLWLTPFDVISVPSERPRIPFFKELTRLLAAPPQLDSSEDEESDSGESDRESPQQDSSEDEESDSGESD